MVMNFFTNSQTQTVYVLNRYSAKSVLKSIILSRVVLDRDHSLKSVNTDIVYSLLFTIRLGFNKQVMYLQEPYSPDN